MGLCPDNFSGHSLRAGLATSAAAAGVSSWEIRQQTGHASDAMLNRYIRDGELFTANAAGALACLGDMPRITSAHLEKLINAFDPGEGRVICVPTKDGKRGNPVLWGARLFAEIADIEGDVGARHLIGKYAELVCEVPIGDDAIFLDIDTPDALARARRQEDDATP